MKNWVKEHTDTLIIVGSLMAGVWTVKTDIHQLDQRLSDKIQNVEERMSVKIQNVEERLNAKIDALDVRLTAKIDELDTRLTKVINDLDKRLTSVETVLMMQGAPIKALAKSPDEPVAP